MSDRFEELSAASSELDSVFGGNVPSVFGGTRVGSTNGSDGSTSTTPTVVNAALAPPQDGQAMYVVDETVVGTARHPRVVNEGVVAQAPRTFDGPGTKKLGHTVNFRLTKAQFDWIVKQVPNIALHSRGYNGHDHPCAHTITDLATRTLLASLPNDSYGLDLYGNPTANERFNGDRKNVQRNRFLDTLVTCWTEKDYIRRALKWGSEFSPATGARRYYDDKVEHLLAVDPDCFGEYNQYVSIHTLYYMAKDTIARLLSKSADRAVLNAIVHRHKDSEGYLCNGEMKYTKANGMVVQTNVETLESYTHADISWLWESTTKVYRSEERVVEEGEEQPPSAFTWTLTKFTEETWIVQIVACPWDLDEGIKNRASKYGNVDRGVIADSNNASLIPRQEMLPKDITIPGARVERLTKGFALCFDETERKLNISCPELYNFLRTHVSGRSRNAETLKGLYALARREANVHSSFPGALRYDVPPEYIADHVMGAFLADVKTELSNLEGMTSQHADLDKHAAITKRGTRVIGFSALVETVASVVDCLDAKQPARKVLDLFNDGA